MALQVRSLMKLQYTIKDNEVLNPRARQTIPYVGKVMGVPLSRIIPGMLMEALADGRAVTSIPDDIKPETGTNMPLVVAFSYGLKRDILKPCPAGASVQCASDHLVPIADGYASVTGSVRSP